MESAWGVDHGDEVEKGLKSRMFLAAARSGAKVGAGGKLGAKAKVGRSLHPASFNANAGLSRNLGRPTAPQKTSAHIMGETRPGGAPSLATNTTRQANYARGQSINAAHAKARDPLTAKLKPTGQKNWWED